MLTIKNVNAELAKTYFEKGYYQKGRWFGEGASSLNLSGEIEDHDAYNNLLDGQSPDGTESLMGRKIKGNKHRAAIDCTFNAPKSVSLQALVGGDERLIEAHRKAVNQTLALMESRYAQSRILKKGQPRQVVHTGKMAIAQFDHIETRDLDPHLHTHCVVMNVTQREDGKWRSLHNDAIYRQQKLLGMVYQHNLALELMKLGYQVVAKKHGQFEIAGYEQKDLESFSKRRQQILAEAGENASVVERNIAWGNTRVKKEVVNPEELKEKWRQEASQLGVKFVTPYTEKDRNAEGLDEGGKQREQEKQREQGSRGRENKANSSIDPNAIFKPTPISSKKVLDAISHCEERAVAFRQEDLEKFILLDGQPISIESLDQTIGQHSSLINVSDNLTRRYTTEAALQRELATIRLMLEGKNQQRSICSQPKIDEVLDPILLTEGQHEAISTALSTRDGVIAWQGVAGAGKTYALSHFTAIAQENGYDIKGFAPSAEAAKVLGNEVDIKTDTVASLLYSKGNQANYDSQPQQIWIVDEAGLLSASAAYELLQRAKAEKARVLLVGDTRQLSAVEAGNPFKSLQAAGMTTARMNQSLRQRTPELQTAVDFISKGEIDAGFGLLDQANCLIEVTEDEKINKIVSDYLKIPQADREKTLVLAGTNAERLAITQQIRRGLKEEGKLGKGVHLTQLKSKDLTRVQMRSTHHLDIGDLVSPVFNYKQRQLTKGELYEIIDKDTDTLTLSDSTGKTVKVDPLFEKAVYGSLQIEIAPGDRLKWTRNDKKQGRRNGQEFTVRAIEGITATIEYKDGQQDQIDFSVPQHLDYGLVSTTYSSQGKTAERVLISADYTIGKESFYVAVSRVKSDLKLYTSDRDNLLELAKASRAKENPLELLRARQKASLKVKAKTKEKKASGKEVLTLTHQESSISEVKTELSVTDYFEETSINFVQSVPSTMNSTEDNSSESVAQFKGTTNENDQVELLTDDYAKSAAQSKEMAPEEFKLLTDKISEDFSKSQVITEQEVKTLKDNLSELANQSEIVINEELKSLTNDFSKSVTKSERVPDEEVNNPSEIILDEKVKNLTDNLSKSVIESESVTDLEVKKPANKDSESVTGSAFIFDKPNININDKLKEINSQLADSNRAYEENKQRLKELEQRLRGEQKTKLTPKPQVIKSQHRSEHPLSYPTPKPTSKPSRNQPSSSEKIQPSPSSEQRLADLNNLPAIMTIIRLVRFLNPKPQKGFKKFEHQQYIFQTSTDEQTIELHAKDGRGLILQRKDGKIRGNLNLEDREVIAEINTEIDQRLHAIENKRVKESQQYSQDDELSL